MATYNGGRYLEKQLQSISSQKFLPQELCVTDDGSSDSTLTILEDFAATAPFVTRIFRNSNRLGYGRNFLKAASICTSDYVAFCDQDDIWSEDKLEKVQLVIDEKFPDIIVHSGLVVNHLLLPTGERYPDIQSAGWLAGEQLDQDFFCPGYSQIVKKDTLLFLGIEQVIIDEKRCRNTFAHDRWVFDAVRGGATCYQLPDALVKYRQHATNYIGFNGVKTSSETKSVNNL